METVMIYHIINKGTLDEDAMRSLEQKDCGQSAIIDAVKARIGGVNGASRSLTARPITVAMMRHLMGVSSMRLICSISPEMCSIVSAIS